jgi:transcriptional regulator with XRE-family HTH domain
LGLSAATATKWKKGAVPRDTTLQRVADYFGVTVDYLLGEEKKELASPLTPTLTPEEQLLLTQWRSHPDAQPFVRKLLDMPEPQEQERPAVS